MNVIGPLSLTAAQDHRATKRDTSCAPETFLSTSVLGNAGKVALRAKFAQKCVSLPIRVCGSATERGGLSRLFSMEMYGDGTTAFSSRCVHTGLKLSSLIGMTQAAHIHL